MFETYMSEILNHIFETSAIIFVKVPKNVAGVRKNPIWAKTIFEKYKFSKFPK